VFDHEGKVRAKSGLMDFRRWYRSAFGKHSPWGDEDSPALVIAVETALERELSLTIMRAGTKPAIEKLAPGRTLVEQGERGDAIFVLLDGVVTVEVDGQPLAEVGPGAVVGERALLEGGLRTSTLRAATTCKVAVAAGRDVARPALTELSAGHRREEHLGGDDQH
jgi:hypothetical protein